MNDLKAAWSKLMGSDLMRPLSPVARVCFVAVVAALTAVFLAIFVIDLLTYASSTGALIFLVLPIYAGLAYCLIFGVDSAFRLGFRAMRR